MQHGEKMAMSIHHWQLAGSILKYKGRPFYISCILTGWHRWDQNRNEWDTADHLSIFAVWTRRIFQWMWSVPWIGPPRSESFDSKTNEELCFLLWPCLSLNVSDNPVICLLSLSHALFPLKMAVFDTKWQHCSILKCVICQQLQPMHP